MTRTRTVRMALAVLAAAGLAGGVPAAAASAGPPDRATHPTAVRHVPAASPPAGTAAAAGPAGTAPGTAVGTARRGEPDCTGERLGDARLGPEHLPGRWEPRVGPLLQGWRPTGSLTPAAFLEKYWTGPAEGGTWKYPPNDGFAEVNGTVDREATRLEAGQLLDRFGSEYGGYLAPAGDRYAERALPPQNLHTRDPDAPCDYRVYQVTKPFWVWQGAVAPWFEQPGGGEQIKLDPVFLDPGEGRRLNVTWLLEHGYLAAA
ncbi:TNT domain-containing protein [Streptomyces sp. WMMC500]|uniref:TNT domain-containing protein n=1 Tax=Streptomyces sp. WMMC500 TaxID=3015154 RepID=UPI00248C5CA9|nr:TNT domain-containing protein [Streptomyces sp. WMMC500]WBB59534.1 TNT domain-containing protein [Streptomyces sp. WMMC500]